MIETPEMFDAYQQATVGDSVIIKNDNVVSCSKRQVYGCTRYRGHKGCRHAAETLSKVIEVWDEEGC